MRLPRAAAMAAGLSWLAGACGEKADDGAGSTTTPSDSSTNSPYDGSANTPSDGPINTPSDGPPSSVSTSPVPLESVCEFYLEQYCTMLVQCGGSSETSVERCRAERDCRDLPDLRSELAAGWVEYDPAA